MANAVNKRVNIYINGVEVENSVKGIRAEMVKLVNEQNKMTIGSDEYIAHSKKIQDLNVILQKHRDANRAVNKELENTKNIWGSTLVKWAAGTVLIKSVSDLYSNLKSKIQELSEEFARYDDTLSSTEKYTQLTRKQVLELTEDLKNIDTRTSIENLQKLAQEAGKLGITGRQDILDFVEAANIINIALGEDLGEDAVLNIGKLAMMYGDDQKYGLKQAMLNTASAINQVAQSSSASEPYLMDFMARLSGTGEQAGLTQAQIIGLGSAMDQNMQELEVSTSAISQLLIKMYQDPSKFAAIAGMDVKEFSRLMKEDANEGFLTLINTLSKKGGLSELAPIFKEMNLDGVRASQIISVLAGNIDNIRQQQENANKAYTEGTSVINEYNRMNENQAAALEKAKNAAALKRAELGEKLIPILTLATKAEGAFWSILSKIPKFLNENKAWLFVLAAALVKYELALLRVQGRMAINYTLHIKDIAVQKAKAIATDLATLRLYMHGLAHDVATRKITLTIAAQEALRMVMMKTPWGLVLAGVAALGVGIYKLVTINNKAKKSFEDINKSVADKTAGTIVQLERLSYIWKLTGDSLEEKQKFIDKNKDAFDQLGVSIKTVADAENLLINNKDAFINMLKDKAYASAYMEAAEEIMKKNSFFTKDWVYQVMTLQKEIDALTSQMNELPNTPQGAAEMYPIQQQINYLEGFKEDYQSKIDAYNKDALEFIRLSDQMTESANKRFKANGFTDNKNEGGVVTPPVDPEKWEAFYKKVEDLRTSFKKKALDGYAKEKEDIVQKYDELIEEATKFGAKGTAVAKELEIEKGKAIITAGEKYLEKYNDIIKKINGETDKIRQKTNFSPEQSAFVKELLGSDQEWNDHINAIAIHINTLNELLIDSTPEEAVAIQKKLDELTNSYVTAVQGKTQSTLDIIKKYAHDSETFIIQSEEYITDSTLNEHDKRVKEIKKKYDAQIKITTETLEKLRKINEEKPTSENEAEIKRLEEIIVKLEALKGKEIDVTLNLKMDSKSIWEQILSPDFWKNFQDNFRESLGVLADAVGEISNSMLTIYDDIIQYQAQVGEYELDQYRDTQDKKLEMLQKQLDSGVISQNSYNKKVEEINRESLNKENAFKRKQFEKERGAKIAQVLIEGGLAVAKAFSQYGWPWGLIPAGLSTIQTGVQTGLIASQPNPYRKGGYIPRLMNIVAGEEGPEWMANNKTLNDPKTGGLIRELDNYQKGKRSIFDGAAVDNQSMSQMFAKNGSIFTSSNSKPTQEVNNYYTTDTDELKEMKKELKQLNQYMSDPRNRQAYLSRELQIEFDKNELFLRNLAKS